MSYIWKEDVGHSPESNEQEVSDKNMPYNLWNVSCLWINFPSYKMGLKL